VGKRRPISIDDRAAAIVGAKSETMLEARWRISASFTPAAVVDVK
jgi:hypothetical protein